VIHEAVAADVQLHPDWVVSVIVPIVPAAGAVIRMGLAENVQGARGSLTTKVWPAIVSVAVRGVTPVFASAENETVPVPVTGDALDIVTHDAPLAAVQEHSGVVVTVTEPLPPAAVSVALAESSAYAQGAPDWLTVKDEPAIVSVPVRGATLSLAATANVTAPGPDPGDPDVIVIQAASLVAVHAHPAATVTVLLPPPPAAATDCDAGEMPGAQGRLNANVFERLLDADPVGPTADTTAS
jgi:hypothetical protein